MAVQFRDGIGALRKVQRQYRHHKGISPGLGLFPQIDELIAGDLQLGPNLAEVFVDQPQGEHIVPGWDWGVGGKNVAGADFLGSLVKSEAGLFQFTDAFYGQEG